MTFENVCARSFVQLVNLKARSRQHIDIQSQGGLNFNSINRNSNNNDISIDNDDDCSVEIGQMLPRLLRQSHCEVNNR